MEYQTELHIPSLNVLVLGAGGNVSIGIIKTLKQISSVKVNVYAACVTKDAAGFALSDFAILSPMASNPEFHDWLDHIEQSYSIDVVLSGVEEVNLALADRNIEGKAGPIYLIPEKNHMMCFSDKLETTNWLKLNKINYPETFKINSTTNLIKVYESLSKPFIIKPRFGKGSQGVHLIHSYEQFSSFAPFDDYVAQQCIGTPDSEYTCGVYPTDDGDASVIVMKRRLKNGSTSIAEVVFDKAIEQYCRDIAIKLKTQSPFNVQLRVSSENGHPYCFEINMRLSGTTFIRHNFGFPDCEAWLLRKAMPNMMQPIFGVRKAKAIRYEAEVFIEPESLEQTNLLSAIKLGLLER
ncbi:ATP-grasp domain-containing protein [Rheinheimera sp. MM224]|uniref:ATP-grasp domain-containing protein n=1 Tax=Rheinheimera sp. MM224 TaxID=3019969 RepID=UPI0021F8D7F2|nr:ATP-grasp domain-containing protein [Rheinheimera sp. MM224]CAI3796573.1 hypothetical protein JAMGFMIE_01601 [Rheinheimera sp. MM224]